MRSLPIGRLSKESGVNIETIRYYERAGILARPPRSPGGRRIYDEGAVERLRFVRRVRELGFTLGEVRTLLAMADRRGACPDVRALALRHLADVRAKMADLRRLERTLARSVEACARNRSPVCPLIQSLRVV